MSSASTSKPKVQALFHASDRSPAQRALSPLNHPARDQMVTISETIKWMEGAYQI